MAEIEKTKATYYEAMQAEGYIEKVGAARSTAYRKVRG